NKETEDIPGQVRGKLADALMELLQRDFAAAEPHLKEIEELSRDKGPTPEETTRRRARFLVLAGLGREKQDKRLEAVRYYIEMAGVETSEPIALPDDPALKQSSSLWVSQRLDLLMKSASPQEKEQIEKELLERLKQSRTGKDPE